ncbi:MAG: TonB family protein [Pseudomonadota bacterium]
MISGSRTVLVGALVIALAAHGLGLHELFGEEIEIEGASGGVQASLGNSFADMAAGTVSAEDTTEVTQAVTAQTPTETPDAEEVTDPVEPQDIVEDLEPPEETPQETVTETDLSQIEELVDEVVEEEVVEQVETVVPIAPMEPIEVQPTDVQPVEVAQPEPIETLEAVEENTSAVTRSLRPQRRTPEFEKQHEPPPPEPRQRVAQPQPTPQPRGNAAQNTTAGSATGTQQQTNTRASGTGNTAQTGNAAASNYPGQVMQRLSRVSRPRVGTKGTARISFSVSSSGGLAGLSVSKSSGSARLDQAALSMVRRAAPFPAPPPGARRNFSINIQGQ